MELAEELVFSNEVAEWSKKYLYEIRDLEVENLKVQTDSRNNYLTKLQERKQRAKDAYLDGTFTQQEYLEEKRNLEKEEMVHEAQPKNVDWYSIALESMSFSDTIKTVWKHGDISHKREVLRELKSNFVWDEQNLNVFNVSWVNTLIEQLPTVTEEINKIEQEKSLVKQGDLADFKETFPSLCGWRESNSRPLLGRQIFYH